MTSYEKWSLLIGAANAIFILATLIVLCLYTKYTKQIHQTSAEQLKELIRQRRLGIMPSIMVLGQPGELQIMNVGNGPAVNVNIKSFVPQELDDKFEFEQVSLLRPGDCRRVNFKINGSIRQSNLKSHEQLFGEAVAKTLKLGEFRIIDIAEFYDIEGSFYKQLLPETESGVRPGFVKLIEEGKGATLIAQEK